jgi:hypothetical protein
VSKHLQKQGAADAQQSVSHTHGGVTVSLPGSGSVIDAGAFLSALDVCWGVVDGRDLDTSPGGAHVPGLLKDNGFAKFEMGHLDTACRHSSSCA